MLKLLAFVLPLGLDSFAVAAALGTGGLPATQRWRVSVIFVVFEAGMPLIGLAAGAPLARAIGGWSGYLAAAALLAAGAGMLLSGADDEGKAARLLGTRGSNSYVIQRVLEGKSVFYVAVLWRASDRTGDRTARCRVSVPLRPAAAPFVAAAAAGARVRTRLRVSAQDEAVLWAAGRHLGSLAGHDLAARCAERRPDAKGGAASRAPRKRALTAESSSRWAGAITRTSEDQVRLAGQNLRAQASSLRTRIRRIQARLPVPAGGKAGRVRGYATGAERHAKTVRLQVLRARLAGVERRIGAGSVPVVRGGKALLRKRGNLAAAGLTEAQWRAEWEAARLFLTADGEKDKAWGNETIRWNPDEGWLEIRLPARLASLANQPHSRYRLSAPVGFSYRGAEVAAQAATGAVRYDISCDPVRGRWYVDASWKAAPAPAPCLEELRAHPVLAVDLNHGHLAVWAVTPDGNPAGPPVTVSLALSGMPASRRDGRLRAAISAVIGLARQRGCQAIVMEDLNFADAREQGRERRDGRPSRGRRGRSYRALVSGIPTARFRDRLVQMAANAGLAVIAVDPAYTSRWGAEHWLGPLRERISPVPASGHHAAAVVIGRRALGQRARRRAGVTGGGQRTGRRRAAPRAPAATRATRDGRPRQAQRQPHPRRMTATARRTRPPDQAAQDRPGPPTSQDYLLLVQ